MRVYELAKELQMSSKALMEHLAGMGIAVKMASSGLTEEQVEAVRRSLHAPSPAEPARVRRDEPVAPSAAPPEPEVQETVRGDLVERRIGMRVIRRRKMAEPEPVTPAEPEGAPEQLPAVEQVTPAPEPEPSVAVSAEPAAIQPEPSGAPEAEAEAPPSSGVAPQETVPETTPLQEAPAAPPIKKIRITEKERTPARVISRIDLGNRIAKTDEHQGVGALPQDTTISIAALTREQEETRERIKRALKDKDKGGRKKFRWQEELDEEDELETPALPFVGQRVRYKIKDRPPAKVKKHRGESIAVAEKKEPEKTVPKAIKRKIKLHEGITVSDLARRMGVKGTEVIKKLIALGIMATVNHMLDTDTATLVAADFGYEVETVPIEEEMVFEDTAGDVAATGTQRRPVVTVMGHVDHGKTTLLDAIRKTNVAGGEKGGITQHIGAYRVTTPHGEITFIDTPGHEAFTTMRARGAKVTDIVILVVAAEEGVKPQTIEALNHAKAAGVPIIVAVNKIDKPDANPDKVRQELSQYGLVPEEWGGETIYVNVSAKKNQGIDRLLEMVLLQAEMMELKADPDRQARGVIIEARLDRGRGPIATVLVQEGTLRVGDSFVSRHNFGKVRALIDDTGALIREAGPATPVEVVGFSSVPEAGDKFVVIDEKKARQTSLYWQEKRRKEELRRDVRVSLENFYTTLAESEIKELRLVVKADVQGSVEALKQSLENLSTDEIKVRVIHASVGAVSLNDVMLAAASQAIIIGFNVKTEPKVDDAATREQVDIRLYGIIYDVVDDVKNAMSGMLAPEVVERVLGKAEVRQVFTVSKIGTVAGCFVVEGKIANDARVRIMRSGSLIHDGTILSLKRFKDDVKEVLAGQECGIGVSDFRQFEAGDIIECYTTEEVRRRL
ncbi:MAG: translation initiation factor IF-2 [Desulfobacterota bacterium]|nr:translation initiation factor IF-2 [Thermodesulfobacteriota bacterium]